MTGRRVLLAAVEVAGVGSATRDALRRRGNDAHLWVIVPHPFQASHDRLLEGYRARAAAALRAPFAFDVLHLQAGNTLAEFLDVAWARIQPRRRPVVVMHYWGDDVRLRLRTGQIPIGADADWRNQQLRNERLMRRRLRLAARLCDAAIVSDLELADHARQWFRTVYLVPTPLELEGLPQARPAERPVARIVHAPSHRLKKGTDTIVSAVERLSRQRPVELRLLERMPRRDVWNAIADADIVVDQLGSQTTGVLALETMAIGRPVMVQYQPELLAPFARDTPAIAVSPETLEDEMARLLDDPDRRRRIGSAGRAFVRRVHDSDAVAAAIEHVYDDARSAGPGLFEATPNGVRPLASGAA
ncbi:MAG: glycosyltransferase [Solirubrobacteraceae bacterium]